MVGISTVNSFIGRLFGNNTVADTYVQKKSTAVGGEVSRASGTDIVELSANAPRPLDSKYLEDASAIGKKINAGEELSESETARLREDRVFAALAVMSAISLKGGGSPRWPGGFPAPTAAELDAAYKRLTQKLMNLDSVRNPEAMQKFREDTLDQFRGTDFEALVSNEFGG